MKPETRSIEDSIDVESICFVDDLLEYEGPLLTFCMKDSKCYLALWVDVSKAKALNYWILIELTSDQLGQYLASKLSLLNVMRAAIALYSFTTSSSAAKQMATRIEFSDIKQCHLPSENSFFDERFTRDRRDV